MSPERHSTSASDAPNRRSDWLPDFCQPATVLPLLIIAGATLLTIQLAPAEEAMRPIERLTIGMLVVLVNAALAIATLCALRPGLAELRTVAAVAIAMGLVAVWAVLGSALTHWLDRSLGLAIVPGNETILSFVLRNVAVAMIVWAIALRYFYVRGQWLLEVKANATAKLDALQARIRPHFLFNSLNTIASLIRSRPQDAERAVEDLSDLFRLTLRAGTESTLADEVELVSRYLAVEQVRLGGRLTVVVDCADAPPGLPIPALSLQPLVENAIVHGIQQIEEGGTVRITARTHEDRVEIEVVNPLPTVPGRLHRGSGTALANIRQRLRHRHGDRAALEVAADGHYHRAKIIVPLP